MRAPLDYHSRRQLGLFYVWLSLSGHVLVAVDSVVADSATVERQGTSSEHDFLSPTENSVHLAERQAPLRGLATITNSLAGASAGLALTVSSNAVQGSQGQTVTVPTGTKVTAVDIVLAGADTFDVTGARMKLVQSTVSTAAAQAGACKETATSLGLNRVISPFGDDLGSPTQAAKGTKTLKATPVTGGVANLRMGGSYKVCYSDDGKFGVNHADVVPVTIDAPGVYDPCTGDNCLAQKKFKCHALKSTDDAASYGSLGTCAVQIASIHGTPGKVTLSQSFLPKYQNDAFDLTSSQTKECAAIIDTAVFCPHDGINPCEGADFYSELDQGNTRALLPRVRTKDSTKRTTVSEPANALAACYCPNYNGCDGGNDFPQQIGIVVVYVSKVCHPIQDRTKVHCAFHNGYAGVTPNMPFKIMVHCPWDACTLNDNARIKIVDHHADNDKPAWDPAGGCRTAVQTTLHESPENCKSATKCALKGGSSQVYKLFGDKAGMRMTIAGVSSYEQINYHSSVTLDVCFCDDSCTDAANWFKVGRIIRSPMRLMPFQSCIKDNGSPAGCVENLAANPPYSTKINDWIVNVPTFAISFARNKMDKSSLGLSTGTILKILSDPQMSVTDSICGSNPYSTGLISGFTAAKARSSLNQYVGAVSGGNVLKFGGGSVASADNWVALTPGPIAICYCSEKAYGDSSVWGTNPCLDNSQWALAAHYVVRGPTPNQAWTFSTDLVVRLSYTGHGLASTDTLRIIPNGVACTANNNNPNGDTQSQIKIGCPDDGCSAMGDRNIAVKTSDQFSVRCDENNLNCQKVYVRAVRVISSTATEVEFTSDPDLETNDVIVLEDNIACAANCDSVKLAAVLGIRAFGDDASTKYHVGHKVTATRDLNKFTIPIGWSSPDVPQFTVNGVNGEYGRWRRTSVATTKVELKAGAASGGPLKVCWSYGGDRKYVAQVGQITFLKPAKMPEATVYLTTNKHSVTAPVIIGFTTGNGNDVAKSYGEAKNSMQLRILVKPITKLDFHYADQDGKQMAIVPTEDERGEASQGICGKLFLELWSIDDKDGFPLPKGCYYKRRTGQAELEISIVFDKKNGLRPGKKYQIVLNAHAYSTLTKSTKIITLMSMQDTVLKPYEAVEVGEAMPSLAVKPGATGTDPQFQKPGGLTILGGTDSVLELKGELKLRFELAGDAKGKIVKDTILKIFMFPLTQWDMGYTGESSDCQVTCTPHGKLICGTPQTCTATAVAGGTQSNVIYIKLPSDMADVYDTIKHQFLVEKLTLPKGGFFPNRIAAQIGKQDDSKPDYVISGGDFLWKQPDKGVTVGELVTRPGDGNSKPFKMDKGNTLYVRLVLGASLHALRADDEASFSISLPKGYLCIRASEAPTTLGVFGGLSPQGRGTPNLARWSYDGNICNYYFKKNDIIYAGSAMIIKLIVDNPEGALPRDALANTWEVVLRGNGLYTSPKIVDAADFHKVSEGSEATDFGSNVAVVGKMANVSMQPMDFRISLPPPTTDPDGPRARHVEQDMYVFFKSEQTAGFESSVLLQAPVGFDFGAECEPGTLPDLYYVTGLAARTYPLPVIATCTGGRSTAAQAFNRAEIKLTGLLHVGRQYGFKIKVANPVLYDGNQHNQWELWTKDKNNYYVDGADGSPPFNAESESSMRSWGMYQRTLNVGSFPIQVGVSIAPLLPFSVTATEATITVFPLKVVFEVETSLRITAPQGFEWHFSNQEFTYRSASTTNSTSLIVPQATADLPGGIPVRHKNELRWKTVTYKTTEAYGFITRIRVPDHSPRSSSNAFFVEFGYNEDTCGFQQRSMAARLEAPAVQSLEDAHVGYMTNVRGKVNTMRFQVQTATTVPNRGGLTITGPPGFEFPESCRPTAVSAPGNAPFPIDLNCNFRKASDGRSQISLIAGESGIPPGRYVFELTGDNPKTIMVNMEGEGTPCGTTQCWIFQSIKDVQGFTSFEHVDMETSAVGFSINEEMISAGLPLLDEIVRTATGRNDQPGQPNQLIFSFQLNRDVSKQSILKLRGPEGFVFAEDCLQTTGGGGVITNGDMVFGNKANFIPGYDSWELGVLVFSCKGEGPNAALGIGAGLQRGKKYVFRINIAKNPTITPQQNKWTVDYSDESSEPFDGFPLWTFTRMSATTVSTAMSQADSTSSKTKVVKTENLVTIKFRPYNVLHKDYPEKAKTALLTVTAPEGFVFVSEKKKCTIMLEEADFITSSNPLLPFVDSDYTCTVPVSNKNQLVLEMVSEHGLSSGRDYTLTIKVLNPTTEHPQAKPWKLETTQGTRSLDSGTLSGFPVNKVLLAWFYDNKNALGEPMVNGGVLVDGLLLTMRFPDRLQKLDQIIVHAPIGFSLTDPKNKDGQKKCYNFKWEPIDAGYFTQSPTTCEKNRMTFLIMEVKTFPAGRTIKFRMDTVNPRQTPETISNYWSIVHQSAVGETMSTDVFKGWTVVPQLEGVGVKLIGHKMAARSMSEIEVTFKTVSNAESFELTAKRPLGFDFSGATVTMIGQSVARSSQASLTVKLKIKAAETIVSRIRDVKLGMVGGNTIFDLTTYNLHEDGKLHQKVDQKLSFSGGFRLPGKIEIHDSLLQSEYNLNSALYPVKSLWRVQMGSPAVVSFSIEMTYPVGTGESLIISSPTYTLKLEGFSLMDSQTMSVVRSEVMSAKEGRLVAQLKQNLHAGRKYQIITHVVTPVGASLETWRIETSDAGPLPTNTNDGLLEGFNLVSGMEIKVTAPRSPPMAEIEVSLLIDPRQTAPTSLVLVAPLGFNFTENCLVTGAGFVTGCEPSRSIAGLPAATLACKTGGLNKVVTQNLRVKVSTPDATPDVRSWFVVGKFAETDEQVGWGQDPEGFAVKQMEDTNVQYAGMPLIDTQMIVQFKTREQMDLGAQIKVLNPSQYTVRCSGDQFNPIYLPGILECTTRRGFFMLALNDTLAPGSYAFSVIIETPRNTPARRLSGNKFSLLLLDKNQQVQDASMNMAGQEIRSDFVAQALDLSWTSSEAGQASSITLGFKVRSEIPRGVVADFLIMLPTNYAHAIEKKDSVRSLNSMLPLREVGTRGWVDFRMMDRLVIHLDPNKPVPVGEYKFILPVTVPEQMPVGNFWRISLCGYSDTGPCLTPESPQSLVTFPLAGFKIGQLAPGQSRSRSDKKASTAPLSFRHGLAGLGPFISASLFALLPGLLCELLPRP